MDLETYQKLGLHQSFSDVSPTKVVNGRANREIQNALATPGDRPNLLHARASRFGVDKSVGGAPPRTTAFRLI